MKVIRCKDLGVPCDFEARAETEEEVIKIAADHAKQDHHLEEVTEEYLTAWRQAIRSD